MLHRYEKYERFTSKTSTPKHVVTPQDLLVSQIGGISGESGTLTAESGVGPISHKADIDISVW